MISTNTILSIACVAILGGIASLGASVFPAATEVEVASDASWMDDPWVDILMNDGSELDGLTTEAFDEDPVIGTGATDDLWMNSLDPAKRTRKQTPSRPQPRKTNSRSKSNFNPMFGSRGSQGAPNHTNGSNQSRRFYERSRQYDMTRSRDSERLRRNDRRVNGSRIILGSAPARKSLRNGSRLRTKSLFEKTRGYERNGSIYPMNHRNRARRHSSRNR